MDRDEDTPGGVLMTGPPNKEMERTKRNAGTGRRALRAGLADGRFAAHLQRSADIVRRLESWLAAR